MAEFQFYYKGAYTYSMKFVLGSKSEDKREIIEKALRELNIKAEIESVEVDSGITDQPLDKEITLQGAKNRARNAKKANKGADFWVGLEGGLHDYGEGYHLVTYACLIDISGDEFVGNGAEIALPQAVSESVKNGAQFGQVVREYANEHEIDENLISREAPFVEAIQNAYCNYLMARGNLDYRQKTAAIVLNRQNQILLVQLQSYGENDWNIPGGELEESESPKQGLLRELEEELGTDKFEIVEKSAIKNQYDWPDFVVAKRLREHGTTYRGQQQIQFIIRFTGDESQIELQDEEIRKLKWVDYEDLKDNLNFPGQRENIEKVISNSSVHKLLK